MAKNFKKGALPPMYINRNGNLQWYVNQLMRTNRGRLSAEECRIVDNVPYVLQFVKDYQGLGLDMHDLLQEGLIGLTIAAREYDERRGITFLSYAVWHIRKSVTQALQEESQMIRKPETMLRMYRRIKEVNQRYQQEQYRDATVDELADELDADPEEVKSTLRSMQRVGELDSALREDTEERMCDTLVADAEDADYRVEQGILREEIGVALGLLSSRDRDIVIMRHGLKGQRLSSGTVYEGGEMEWAAIGKQFGLGRERVRQLYKKGLHRLSRHDSIIALSHKNADE